jgi:hypothetical protein
MINLSSIFVLSQQPLRFMAGAVYAMSQKMRGNAGFNRLHVE